LFDSLRTIQYADYLYQAGSFSEAINEYERFVFQFAANDNSKLRLVSSYRKVGTPTIASARFNQLWDDPQSVSPLVAKEYFALKLINRDFDNLFESLSDNELLSSNDKVFLSSTYFLLNDEYLKAKELLEANVKENNFTLNSYFALANDGLNIKYKSPALSGSLSAIIPGTGKIYCGQWQDGLIALIMVGTSAWQSYRGFKKNGIESGYGWVFGTLGAGFYIGNITGSVKAANKHNKVKRERIRLRVQTIFNNTL
jgi:hypothetical protein